MRPVTTGLKVLEVVDAVYSINCLPGFILLLHPLTAPLEIPLVALGSSLMCTAGRAKPSVSLP